MTDLDIFGHREIKKNLENLKDSDFLPHGLLFSGPRGIGKATLALHFSYALLRGVSLRPISYQDPLFLRMKAGGHGDFLWVERATDDKGKKSRDISIDAIRRVIDFFSRTSFEGGWRIAVIDSIDDVSRQGANALLKILEEPPQKCLLILISHSPGALLPTILSRVRCFSLAPLTEDETRLVYGQLGQSEALLPMAQGCPGQGILMESPQMQEDFLKAIEGLRSRNQEGAVAFIEKYHSYKENGVDAFEKVASFFLWWLGRGITQQVSSEIQDPFFRRKSLESWAVIWETLSTLFYKTEKLSLERRQALTVAFSYL